MRAPGGRYGGDGKVRDQLQPAFYRAGGAGGRFAGGLFLPSAFKVGRHGLFISIIGELALLGLVLMITGFSMRRNRTEE
ncbi:MAG: hypothetical protein DMG69_28700 [Acidobacteria bacterium]|nr:MAG: hypothetical protein DMG69_28700 [Acidobacteriota bacterium]